MSDTRGVFSIRLVNKINARGGWVDLNDVWIPYSVSDTGYFGGGVTTGPAVVSIMNKLTYSTDTISFIFTSRLSNNRNSLAATGSSSAGYFGGGFAPSVPGAITTIDKLTYLTDTTIYTPSANLSVARYGLGATGSSTAGYFGAGIPAPGGSVVSRMDKLTYSTDTTAFTPGANLSASRYRVTATGNTIAGYFGGGWAPGSVSRMDKLTYSTDTTAFTPGANLSVTRNGLAATGSSTAGYFGGGINPAVAFYSRMDKLTYATDTTAYTPGANLSASRRYLAATGNSTAGYFGGGNTPTLVSTMDKLTYSTDTTAAAPGANLSAVRYNLAASSAKANALPETSYTGRFSDGSAGTPPAETPTSTTSSTAVPNTGYFGGGNVSTTVYSRMDKLTYSTDTTAFTPSASMSVLRYSHAATGSSTAGYFGGGLVSFSPVSRMDRLTYLSDTTSFTPSANLISNRANLTATGNTTDGYFGGGATPSPGSQLSTMDKLTYSTDTTAAAPGANLSLARANFAATGNTTDGYFGGGKTPSPGLFSTMDKLTYSTDTTAAAPGANLSAGRWVHAATGNSTHGYFGGGQSPSTTSTMDKLTYSTDTTAYTPGANLSIARTSPSASSAKANALPQSTYIAPNIV